MMLPGMKNGDTLRIPPAQHLAVIVFDGLDATDSRPHRHTDGVAILLGDFEVGVLDGFHRGGNTVMDKRVVLALVFLRQVVVDIEALHNPRNARGIRAGIEFVDENSARIAFTNIAPGIIQGATYR